VDPLLENDVQLSQATPPGEKLAQALDLMAAGIRLKRAALRNAEPQASEAEIERAVELWLTEDD
jgi:hypothetical protein